MDEIRAESFYDTNPALFEALIYLKAHSVVYQRYDPEKYKALVDMRKSANEILAYDGCRLDINTDFRSVCIRFLPNDEYANPLREKFSAGDMKVYVCLLQIYEENFNSSGAFVNFDLYDLRERIAGAGFRLGSSKKHSVSLLALKEHLAKFATYGIIKKINDTSMVINPGILTCVSRDSFRRVYDDLILPWIMNTGGEDVDEEGQEVSTEQEDNI